ncbi:MAG: MFS transporter, partial [Candidatus Eremiobacteraeota bacterium]|nr:MFS transporter [Candidatus Eremiobacteraeota bacterium]
ISVRDIFHWLKLNALWLPIAFQDAALMTIAVPGAVRDLEPHQYVMVASILGSIANFAAMLVPPFAGWLSDHMRRGGGQRRNFVAAGVTLNVAGLVAVANSHSLIAFGTFYVVAVIGSNVAQAAYQAMLPERIPRAVWGAVSGVRGALTLVGTAVGLGIASWAPTPGVTFLAAAAVVALCSLTLFTLGEERHSKPEHAHVRDWHDFHVVFAARFLVFFGLYLLQSYVLYYFEDVLKLQNAPAGTALAGGCTMAGAVISSVALGIASDRVSRKVVTALAGVPMAMAAIGFAIAPAPEWMFLYAFLFGIGFGGVFSSGWALAMDSIPALSDVARDLGLWGIATNLPTVIAPLIGWPLIDAFGGTRAGYQAVFGLAGFAFFLASLTVLRVGRKPLSSLWGWPLRFAAITTNYVWDRVAYRVRDFGRIPRKRGATLIVANHQHDLESMSIVTATTIKSGPWRHPLYTACSRRMYEPGFMALRLPWARWALRRWNSGPLFMALGMLPLENELSSREISALAWSMQRRHGVMLLSDIFEDRVAGLFAPGTTTKDLWHKEHFDASRTIVKLATLREPYRREALDETRALLDEDLKRMENVLHSGGTFYLTPEGKYSLDGRLSPMRGAIDRLAPLATIYLAGVSYDPFAGKRLSMLYRVARLDDRTKLAQTLAAIRPVVTSQLLAVWLEGRTETFALEDARAAVEQRLRTLPPSLFVDPELARDPRRMVGMALPWMTSLGILAKAGDGAYRLSDVRRHPQFPGVTDIVAYNARFFEETLEHASYSEANVVAKVASA